MKTKEQRKYEKDFKEFCKANRLRLCTAEDGYPIARGSGRRSTDHFFDGFTDSVGVWMERDSKKKFSFAHKKLLGLGCIPLVTCDTEGTYKIPYEKALPVARFLRIVKGAARGTYSEGNIASAK